MNQVHRPTGRFAPSPTGHLHFGSLVSAVASYLDARAMGGRWLVRMEDVDTTRCRIEYDADILRTLEAFGLHWDGEVVRQSQRSHLYAAAIDHLQAARLAYGCECSRKEIADSGVLGIDGPVYPGTCRERELVPGQAHSIRLRIDAASANVGFVDRVQGEQRQDVAREVGDFVLRRRDGVYAYQLAVVIDDADQGVTHVVRGADLLDSTARQRILQRALGLGSPTYLHHPVIVNEGGQKLSKQTLAEPVLQADELTDPRAAARALVTVLRHLYQNVAELPQDSPAELLSEAIRRWDVRRIPNVRTVSTTQPEN